MIRPQLILDIAEKIRVDGFAGGGGWSTGMEWALGSHVHHAYNHNPEALGMHRINHPQTVHHVEDMWLVDPMAICEGRVIGLGTFSPDCTHFSKARGGKPVKKKIRGLLYTLLMWAKAGTECMFMENVEEIKTLGPTYHNQQHPSDCICGKPCGTRIRKLEGRGWNAFLDCLGSGIDLDHPDLPEILELLQGKVTKAELVRGFGYKVEFNEIRAFVYGSPTIRKRLYLIARRDGKPIVWPEPTHAEPKEAKRLGLKPWRTVAENIDWTVPCNSIFLAREEAKRLGINCKRPLAKASEKRIAWGIDKHVLKSANPFILNLTHGGRVEPINEPIKTLTGANRGEKALVDATIAPIISDQVNASSPRCFRADEPMRTQCAHVKGGHFDLAAVNLIKLRGEVETHGHAADIEEPSHVISANGQHHGISAVYLAQHNAGFNTTVGHPVTEPASSITGTGSQQQIVAVNGVAYYKTDINGQALTDPMRTSTANDRFGLSESELQPLPLTPAQLAGARRVAAFLREHGVQFEGEFATVTIKSVTYAIVDIAMRMLTPRELFRCQGFPDSYIIEKAWIWNAQTLSYEEKKLSKKEQIKMCGNSVCPHVAEALILANCSDLAINEKPKARPARSAAKASVMAEQANLQQLEVTLPPT